MAMKAKTALQLSGVWNSENSATLGKIQVDNNRKGIKAIRNELNLRAVGPYTITTDAIHYQTGISRFFVVQMATIF